MSNNLRSNPPPPGDRAPLGEAQIPNNHQNGARINGVLNALSNNELDQLAPRLRPFQLEVGDVLQQKDGPHHPSQFAKREVQLVFATVGGEPA